MFKRLKYLAMGLAGLSASQAGASVSLEDEMYAATKDQGTLDAVQLFIEIYPDSKHAGDAEALASELIRQMHREPKFVGDPEKVAALSIFGVPIGSCASTGPDDPRKKYFMDGRDLTSSY